MLKGPIYILKENSTIQSLVGENLAETKAKVYPVICPQPESPPYIVLRQTAKELIAKGCGYNVGFDVFSYAESYDSVEAIDLAAVTALVGSTGTFNGVAISFINLFNTRDDSVLTPKILYVKVSSFTAHIDE